MLNSTDSNVKPDWRAIALNEMHHFNIVKEDLPYVDQILAVYFFDANTQTYCCSATPDYWLMGLYHTVVCADGTPDDIKERIQERYSSEAVEDGYFAVSDIKWRETTKFPKQDDDLTEDDVREYFQGNCPY